MSAKTISDFRACGSSAPCRGDRADGCWLVGGPERTWLVSSAALVRVLSDPSQSLESLLTCASLCTLPLGPYRFGISVALVSPFRLLLAAPHAPLSLERSLKGSQFKRAAPLHTNLLGWTMRIPLSPCSAITALPADRLLPIYIWFIFLNISADWFACGNGCRVVFRGLLSRLFRFSTLGPGDEPPFLVPFAELF